MGSSISPKQRISAIQANAYNNGIQSSAHAKMLDNREPMN